MITIYQKIIVVKGFHKFLTNILMFKVFGERNLVSEIFWWRRWAISWRKTGKQMNDLVR
jgi:hypothetical protein